MKRGAYTLEGSSVNPSVTLPCHMSIFHSVTPDRHGITTNNYIPMVRPVNSLFEQLNNAGGSLAMYYGWEPLRDVSRPGCLRYAEYMWAYAHDNTDRMLTESALACIKKDKPDFVFLYMVFITIFLFCMYCFYNNLILNMPIFITFSWIPI